MKVFIVDIEAVETRYTGEWKTHLPVLLRNKGFDVEVIEGPTDIPSATTPGAFLNFGGTNIYKASQVEKISRLFTAGDVASGDHFIFTDAWHPGIINLRYMAELLGIGVRIHALWHAGSYDPQDFLGRLIGDAPWVRHAEKSFFAAAHHNYFATNFHINMFADTMVFASNENMPWANQTITALKENGRIVKTGWPMEYMDDMFTLYKGMPKEDIVLFPHRIAPEKQVDIFRDLKEQLPQYEFVVCQDQQLTKNEYHNLLGRAKLVFSANLQETLGISWYEGALVDTIPMVPDRLSYTEMAVDDFKYPSEWTEDFAAYKANRDKVVARVQDYVENYDSYLPSLNKQVDILKKNYFSCENLLNNLK